MSDRRRYFVVMPCPFDRRNGPWPREASTGAGRRRSFLEYSEYMENSLEEAGVFRWYRNHTKGKDPRRKRKGEPHAFGVTPLELTPAEWRRFRKAHPHVLCLPQGYLRLPKRGRVAGEPEKSGALTDADFWHLAAIGRDAARTGRRVRVAVIDSGIQSTHDEFADRVIRSLEVDEQTGTVRAGSGVDTNGHGTHVASLIGGRHAGVAPGVRLLDVRAFPKGEARLENVIAALDWIARFETDVRVVNLSAEFDSTSSFKSVIHQLLRLNILFVCAAGNARVAGSPADYDAVLTVGASTRTGGIWTDSASKVISEMPPVSVPDLVAPGAGVWGARAADNSRYETRTGTSQATAIVSGLAALEIELRQPQGTVMADQVMAQLMTRTVPIPADPVRAGRGIAHL